MIVAQSGPFANSTVLLILLAVACILLLVMGMYILVVQPRRRRAPLLRALPLLTSDAPEDLRRAEQLLSESVTSGLRRRDLADARFALGFVRGMLGPYDKSKYQEAATVVSELRTTRGHTAESAYLDLWLQSRLGNHDSVCQLCDEYRDTLDDRLQTRLIASISYLHKAAEHWQRREVEGALHYFDLVRDLGMLLDQIPADVNDLQVVNGIQAIFDNRLADARESFERAHARALERKASTVEADLGLVVCEWKAGNVLGVDQDLRAIVRELDTRAGTLDAPGDDGTATAQSKEEVLLQSNARLLFAVALLLAWVARLPSNGPLPADELDEFRRRIQRVRDFDPELGDASLILGLIEYYFAPTEVERARAIDLLGEATDKAMGVSLPEVLDLVERERGLQDTERDALARFLTLVRAYLSDKGIPRELRIKLKQRLEQYARYRELGEIDLSTDQRGAAPSIDDVRLRGGLLQRRIRRLVAPALRTQAPDDRSSDVERLLELLQSAAEVVVKDVDDLQRAERDLMVRTGEFLLPEDPFPTEEVATSDV